MYKGLKNMNSNNTTITNLNRESVLQEINKILKTRLFGSIRKMIVSKKRNDILNLYDYKIADKEKKEDLLKQSYSNSNKEIATFYLSLYTIFTLQELVKREREIQSFTTEEITILKVNYMYDGVEFNAKQPTRFTEELKKEMEDALL